MMNLSQNINIELSFLQQFYNNQLHKLYSDLLNSTNIIERNISALEKLNSNFQVDYLNQFFIKDLENTLTNKCLDWQPQDSINKHFHLKIKEIVNCEEISLFYEVDDLSMIRCGVTRSILCNIIIEAFNYISLNKRPSLIEIFLFIGKRKILADISCDIVGDIFESENIFSANYRNITSRLKQLDGSLSASDNCNKFSSIRLYIPNKKYSIASK